MRRAGNLGRDAAAHRTTSVAVAGLARGVLLAMLGLPPVELHGPLHQFGIMTPTCGATRALRLVFHGDLSGRECTT